METTGAAGRSYPGIPGAPPIVPASSEPGSWDATQPTQPFYGRTTFAMGSQLLAMGRDQNGTESPAALAADVSRGAHAKDGAIVRGKDNVQGVVAMKKLVQLSTAVQLANQWKRQAARASAEREKAEADAAAASSAAASAAAAAEKSENLLDSPSPGATPMADSEEATVMPDEKVMLDEGFVDAPMITKSSAVAVLKSLTRSGSLYKKGSSMSSVALGDLFNGDASMVNGGVGSVNGAVNASSGELETAPAAPASTVEEGERFSERNRDSVQNPLASSSSSQNLLIHRGETRDSVGDADVLPEEGDQKVAADKKEMKTGGDNSRSINITVTPDGSVQVQANSSDTAHPAERQSSNNLLRASNSNLGAASSSDELVSLTESAKREHAAEQRATEAMERVDMLERKQQESNEQTLKALSEQQEQHAQQMRQQIEHSENKVLQAMDTVARLEQYIREKY